jgi:hypothetical protein
MSHVPRKPTLEELLRLKRAERPTEDFWARFDAELRAKQLTALVEKPSWHALLRAHLARLTLPIGAAAASALAVVTWMQTRPLTVATSLPPAPVVAPAPTPSSTVVIAETTLPAPTAVVVAVADVAVPAPTPEIPSVVAATVADPVTEPTVIVTRFSVPIPDGLNFSGGTLAAVIGTVAAPDFGVPLTALPDIFAPSSTDLPATEVARTVSKDDVRVGEKVLRNLDEERLYASSRRLVALDAGRVSVRLW